MSEHTEDTDTLERIKGMKYGFVTGPAGSGKTTLIKQLVKSDASWGLVTATTGVAARVLGEGTPTVNSALGFFDSDSLSRAVSKGSLAHNIQELKKKFDRVIIDEASMLPAEMLDVIVKECEKAKMGVILVGDPLQLPPVTKNFTRPDWMFNAKCWSRLFAQTTVRLATQYRHTNKDFLKGLNLLRAGRGGESLPFLKKAGVKLSPVPSASSPPEPETDVTIVATNGTKNAIDSKHYHSLTGHERTFKTARWGEQHPDWQKEIPETVSLKVGCRVMILRNKYEDTVLTQANGETGKVIGLSDTIVTMRRDSDNKIIEVGMQETDNGERIIKITATGREVKMTKNPTGGVTYMPIVRAFAVTVHKSQGLTITTPTRVRLWSDEFFKNPAMVYVACSRVKNPKHLDIVGGDNVFSDVTLLEERTVTDPSCQVWI